MYVRSFVALLDNPAFFQHLRVLLVNGMCHAAENKKVLGVQVIITFLTVTSLGFRRFGRPPILRGAGL
jgi:hypothetical protein